ncbi:MAG: dephospho-CoA kinase [Desulfuromonas sp.]|uniref:dephospho-CoA kinase n=1 Tax=Desulfuromonas sp. TaxID=892 RepID=UPI000CB69EF0|nr:dephospho-CoA kinase [Desulfuromonas sp.]PLX86270.1 MAG: dephospho-CoA kinase [Desulfuromonas sp.]
MILGITGGIASGKSTVTDVFRSLGAAVVSADELSREVVRPGTPTLERIVQAFGPGILRSDGTLDRKALGEIVFSDPAMRERLNAITHPAIAARAEERLRSLVLEGERLIVYEAPLLFEAGAEKRVDEVLVVTVDEPTQLERLMARDGIGEAEARGRVAAQMPQAEKASRADFVIYNSGDRQAAAEEVKALFRRLVGASG